MLESPSPKCHNHEVAFVERSVKEMVVPALYVPLLGEKSATANGDNSIAVGNTSQANGLGSISVGQKSIAYQENNVAIGKESAALGKYSTAIGASTGQPRTPVLTNDSNNNN